GSLPRLPPGRWRPERRLIGLTRRRRFHRRGAGQARRPPGWRRPERRLISRPRRSLGQEVRSRNLRPPLALDTEPSREEEEVEALLADTEVDVEDGREGRSCRSREHAADGRGECVEDEAGGGVARGIREGNPDDDEGENRADDP